MAGLITRAITARATANSEPRVRCLCCDTWNAPYEASGAAVYVSGPKGRDTRPCQQCKRALLHPLLAYRAPASLGKAKSLRATYLSATQPDVITQWVTAVEGTGLPRVVARIVRASLRP